MSSNIAEFNLQVFRVIVALYKTTPRAIPIEAYVPIGTDAADENAEASAAGTIVWLHRNGYVTGELHQDRAIPDAQLSAHAFRILQRQEGSAPGRTLGQLILDTDAAAQPHELARVSELLVRRLLGE